MQPITIKVTKYDLQNYDKYADLVQGYPIYGHTDGLCRTDIVLYGKLSEFDFGNDTELEVTIRIKK